VAKRRVGRYSNEFRRACVERMKQCDDISALSRELDIDRRLVPRRDNGTVHLCTFIHRNYLALRERLPTHRMALTSFMVAGLVHAADVAHNAFKAF
jgi:hypothetical protein